MAVLIKAERVERKIRELSERTGCGLTEAVERAVDRELASLPPRPEGRVDRERLARVLAEIDALPKINEGRSDDELLGYNDEGHFD
jgi:antitoxin VapB